MAGKVSSGLAAAVGSFVGLLLGNLTGNLIASGPSRRLTVTVTSLAGTLGGAFAGAALATPSSSALAGQGTAGLPAGVGNTPSLPRPVAPVPHKCTARSANTIAQYIPGGPWTYQRSLPAGTALPPMVTGYYDVVTPQGPKNIPALFSGSTMVLTCPHSGEHFVFASTPS